MGRTDAQEKVEVAMKPKEMMTLDSLKVRQLMLDQNSMNGIGTIAMVQKVRAEHLKSNDRDPKEFTALDMLRQKMKRTKP